MVEATTCSLAYMAGFRVAPRLRNRVYESELQDNDDREDGGE